MSQVVRIECSNCEAVEEYEFESCAILGWTPDGGLFYKGHEFSVSETVKRAPEDWLDQLMKALIAGLREE